MHTNVHKITQIDTKFIKNDLKSSKIIKNRCKTHKNHQKHLILHSGCITNKSTGITTHKTH